MNIVIYTSPMALALATFFIFDPFCILHNHEAIAEQSADVEHFRRFDKQNPKAHFDSFIFGNSRANSFSEVHLKSKLGEASNIFFFNAPGECILNYYKKIQYIKKSGNTIRNAILLIDQGILLNSNNQSPKFHGPVYEHTIHSSNRSYLNFLSSFINYYFTDLFFLKYSTYKLTGNYTPWMHSAFKKPQPPEAALSNKQLRDSLLENHFEEYKKTYTPIYDRKYDPSEIITSINESDLSMLREIKKIFEKDATSYFIIIPPDFHRQKSPQNITLQLEEIFDPSRIFNFTGSHRITNDSTLNYENLHFSMKAGNIILDSIFNRH